MEGIGVHRPRNVDWKRAAALLYGDWGTSKAYVIGLAFLMAGSASLPIIIAICALTAVVAYNYAILCKQFPDGGGVYSAARSQSKQLAVIGALLLIADMTVTAALSGWAAMSYFGVPKGQIVLATMALIFGVGLLNIFGPKHTGSLAVSLAVPTAVVVVLLLALSLPHLSTANLEPATGAFSRHWVLFCGVILALSGVEAIANLTGVMKLDPGASADNPKVGKTSSKSILIVAIEVVIGTALLGWAMLSLPPELKPKMTERWEDMLRFMAEEYTRMDWDRFIGPWLTQQFSIPQISGVAVGNVVGVWVGIIIGLLLLSAVNTAITALIGLMYMMARDGEMPRSFTRLNTHGVPWLPLGLAVLFPIAVLIFTQNMEKLAELYAIGVVGAIALNLGSCSLNKQLPLQWHERCLMVGTFFVLVAVEVTIAYTKGHALFFVLLVVIVGLSLRAFSQRRAGYRTITVTEQVARVVAPESVPDFKLQMNPGQAILVAARGLTPVLSFALEEARLRSGSLYILYVKELAVTLPGPLQNSGPARWQDDPQAAQIMYSLMEQGKQNEVPIVPVYVVSENPAATILDLSATLGIDTLILGSPHRNRLVNLLKGNVVNEVAKSLPENIRLLIYG